MACDLKYRKNTSTETAYGEALMFSFGGHFAHNLTHRNDIGTKTAIERRSPATVCSNCFLMLHLLRQFLLGGISLRKVGENGTYAHVSYARFAAYRYSHVPFSIL